MSDTSVEVKSNTISTAHFWVCSYPFFETSLLVSSRPGTHFEQAQIYLYDSDGELFNEAALECDTGEVGVVEFGPLLGACKIESGLKHAHVELRSQGDVAFQCRFHNNLGATIQGEPSAVSAHQTAFFPVTVAEGRNSMLAFVNHGKAEVKLRCRLYLGKRMPEVQVLVPALGSRVISLSAEFEEYKTAAGARPHPGYLRVSSSSDNKCGVQLVEALNGEKGGYIFSSVS